MNTIFVHRDGRTEAVTSIDRSWLGPAPGINPVYIWVDLAAPSIPESLVLTDSFAFHPLAVEETRADRHTPRIDAYDGYLFAAVAGADADVGFFVGAHYIVSVHRHESKAVADQIDSVRHGGKQFGEGPFAMFHRIVDATVAGFSPVVQKLASCADSLEKRVFERATGDVVREIVRARAEAFDLGQRLSRQQEAAGRLAAREIVEMSDEMAIRFRHVRNQLVRLSDDAAAAGQRLGDLLSAASGQPSRKSWI
jgi:magnesium transporter